MAKLDEILPEEVRYPQEMKCPVCLLLDISSSMSGDPINELNKGVSDLKKTLLSDEKAKKIVELLMITFGGEVTTYPFCTVEDFKPTSFTANGDTPMGEAILHGLELIEKRKEQYREQGIHKHRPWVVIITDGAPTDIHEGDSKWNEVVSKIKEAESNKRIIAWAFGVAGADMPTLNKLLSNNGRVYLFKGFNFGELFQWLSDSLSIVSRSKEGERMKIDAPPANKIELEV